MNTNEHDIQRKREYHRKWRAEHQESVKAAQMRYWTKKIAETRSASEISVKGGSDDQKQLPTV